MHHKYMSKYEFRIKQHNDKHLVIIVKAYRIVIIVIVYQIRYIIMKINYRKNVHSNVDNNAPAICD